MNPKKSLGQHWLEDENSLQAICDAAEVQAGDTVLEIGPGTGELTARILDRKASVVAVELDDSLETDLRKKFNSLPFTLNMLSILDFDLTSLPADYKIVANIPYYLTNHLLRLLSETQHKPILAVLLLQKEVAQRVAASPGDMSLLSVATQLSYKTELDLIIPAKAFTPPPKVDSQILVLNCRDQPLFKDLDEKLFFQLVKAGFSNRRKTLLNSLSGGLRISKEQTGDFLQAAGIKPATRPQELSLDLWHKLYISIRQKPINT